MWNVIALIGFSGSGKSTTARLLADMLEWNLVDLDDELAAQFEMSIPEVFEVHGETAFRKTEQRALRKAVRQPRTVIATGGGASAQPDSWNSDALGADHVLSVTLDARPETMLARLELQHQREGKGTIRPMLAGDDPGVRIASLKATRQDAYDQANITLFTDEVTPHQIAAEIYSLVNVSAAASTPAVDLKTPHGNSAILIGPGIRYDLGQVVRERWPKARRAYIVTDENLVALHLDTALASLASHQFEPIAIVLPSGESSKSFSGLQSVYDQILSTGVERGDVVVALGGGVVGDLAGFVAATVLRGIGLVQVPTSLLAMVDSSIGGKTGINHATGKNLIGTFYQPHIVMIDPQMLKTLPERELRQGWAEIIKHSVIQSSTPSGERNDLASFLVRNSGNFATLDGPALTYLISRNVALKAGVVEADEREAGIRAYLNYGHTLGHAIEASDYQYLHGEAVALGMIAASRIAVEMQLIPRGQASQLFNTIAQFGLPTSSAADPKLVLAKIKSDKKRSEGRLRWVLQKPDGGVCLRDDVPEPVIHKVLESLTPRT